MGIEAELFSIKTEKPLSIGRLKKSLNARGFKTVSCHESANNFELISKKGILELQTFKKGSESGPIFLRYSYGNPDGVIDLAVEFLLKISQDLGTTTRLTNMKKDILLYEKNAGEVKKLLLQKKRNFEKSHTPLNKAIRCGKETFDTLKAKNAEKEHQTN
jgi:hypothetical protein